MQIRGFHAYGIVFLMLLFLGGISFSVNVNTCQQIPSGGTYDLINSLSGANLYSTGNFACIFITASNVVLDCHGFTIDRNAIVGTPAGILINNSVTGTVIKNCPNILNYYDGIYVRSSNSNIFTNLTVNGASPDAGIYLDSSQYNNFSNVVVNNSIEGVHINAGSTNNFSNVTAVNGNYGFVVVNSDVNQFLTCNATNNQYTGFSLTGSEYNVFRYDYASRDQDGFHLDSLSGYSTFQHNTAFNNTRYGIAFTQGSSHNAIYNNTARKAQKGFYFYQSTDNNIANNTARDTSDYSIHLDTSCDNNLFNNNIVINASTSGIVLDAGSNNIINGSSVTNATSYGFYLNGNSNNNTLANSTARNATYAFTLQSSYNNTLINDSAFSSSQEGFRFFGSSNNTLTNSVVTGSPQYGVELNLVADQNNITNNTIIGPMYGIYMSDCYNRNNISGNTITNISQDGISIYTAGADIYNNNITNASGTGIYLDSYDNVVRGNTLSGSIFGIYLTSSSQYNRIDRNNLSVMSNPAIRTLGARNNFTNNTVHDSATGFSIMANHNIVSNNYVYRCASGYEVEGPDNTTMSNNVARNISNQGFYTLGGAQRSIFINNTADNTTKGFWLQSGSSVVTNNTAANNTMAGGYGFYFDYPDFGTNFSGNTAYNNAEAGIRLDSNNRTAFNGDHLYNNSRDFVFNGSMVAYLVNMTNVIFDRPAGDFQNYTNLSMNDSIGIGSNFFMKWSEMPSVAPPYQPFGRRFINITNYSAISIDKLAWNYLQSDVGSYYENGFRLYHFNSGTWFNLPSVLDASANTISISNLQNFSVYGILDIPDNCPIVTSSYNMSNNFVGAPNIVDFSDDACVLITVPNVIFDCNGFNITDNTSNADHAAIFANSSNNVTIRNCPRITNYSGSGIYYRDSNNGFIQNITIVDLPSPGYGIQLEGSSNNTISDNTIANVSQSSIWLHDISNWNTVRNNSMDLSSVDGMTLNLANHTLIVNNTVSNHGWSGFFAQDSSNVTYINDTAYGNTLYGFYTVAASVPSSASVSNATFRGNGYGMEIAGQVAANISNVHLYSNGRDFDTVTFSTGPATLNMTDMIFDHPAGDMKNFTNLTIADTVESSTGYFINWTLNTSAAPGSSKSFLGKFVNITNTTPAVSIDSISWRWTDAEAVAPFNENDFQLWRYNSSGWGTSALNSTPNVAQNSLSLFNMNPASGYGILDVDANCPIITTPGLRNQTMNYSGAPNTVNAIFTACVVIASSDVIFDCNGYNISDNGTGGTYGVYANSSYSNVTIRNCPRIADYVDDVYLDGASNSRIVNVTALNGFQYGIISYGGSNVVIADSTARGAVNSAGFGAFGSSINLTNNTAIGNKRGFYTDGVSSTNIIFRNNSAINSTIQGFYAGGSASGISVINNTIQNSQFGVEVSSSSSDLIANNTIYNSTSDGISLDSFSSGNLVSGNTVLSSYEGIMVGGGSLNNNLTFNAVNDSTHYGIYVDGDYTLVLGNRVFRNTDASFSLISLNAGNYCNAMNNTAGFTPSVALMVYTRYDNVTGNSVFNASRGIQLAFSGNNSVRNNTAYNCTTGISVDSGTQNSTIADNSVFQDSDGIKVSQSQWNMIANNTAYLNSNNGIYSTASSGFNTYTNNTAHSNTVSGFWLETSSNNTLSNNIAYNNSNDGFDIIYSSNNNTLRNNLAYDNQLTGISVIHSSNNNTLVNNTAYNNSIYAGFIVYEANYTLLANNTAYNNADGGFYLWQYNYYNTFINNSAYNSTSGSGFIVNANSSYNTFVNNTAFLNQYAGFEVNGYNLPSNYNNFTGNSVYNNTWGFYVYNCTGNNLTGNNVTSNFQHGVYLLTSADTLLASNNIANNPGTGIYANSSTRTTLSRNHYYGNFIDLKAESIGVASTLNLSYDVFDSPPGANQNFTNLSINDSVEANAVYTIKWTKNSSALQPGFVSFKEKFVNISTVSGAPSIDTIVWNWQNSEVGVFNESRLRLVKYNSSWTILNSSADTSGHTFILKNMIPASDYGILQDNDTTAPTVNLNNPAPSALFNSTNVTFNFTATDDASSIMNCSLYIDNVLNRTNSSTANNTPTTFSVTGFVDGPHSWNVSCTDLANNTNFSATRSFTVDTVAPTVGLITPANAFLTNSSTVAFTFAANDTYSPPMNCSLYIDGAYNRSNASTANNTATTLSVPTIADGFHSWNVSCKDQANNTGFSTTRTFTVDTTAPTVGLITPANAFLTNSSNVSFTFAANDTYSPPMNCSLYIDGAYNRSNASTANNTATAFSVSGIVDGPHTWNVTCKDLANNTGNSISRTFTVDTTPPTVGLITPANAFLTNSSNVSFTFAANDTYSPPMNCSLYIDNSYRTSNISTANNTMTILNATGIADGPHTWNVSCKDQANNTGFSATRSFTVDTVAPTVGLITPANAFLTNSSNVSFTFAANDTYSPPMNCSLFIDGIYSMSNATTANNTATTLSVPTIADGSHTWNVSCKDLANNTGFSTTRTFTVDTVAPTVGLITPAKAFLTNSSNVSFTFAANDTYSPPMNCSLYIDGIRNQTNPSTANNTPTAFTVSGIQDGPHTWNVSCKDQANNTGWSASRSFTVDTTAPTVGLITPANNFLTNVSTVSFTFAANDTYSPPMNCSLFLDGIYNTSNSATANNTPTTFSVSGIVDGPHTWNVSCKDQANNTGASGTRAFTVDTVAPSVALNLPLMNALLWSSTVHLTFTPLDNLSATMNCSLYLDGTLNISGLSVPNNTQGSFTVSNLPDGIHPWYVSCRDSANNTGVSVIRNFTVDTSTHHEAPSVSPLLAVDLDSSCSGNVVTVRSGNAEIEGASVYIDNADNLMDVASGPSDGNGQIKFTGCDLRVRIRASKGGYETIEAIKQVIACEQCVECVTDNNCPDNKICSNQHCIGFACSCGHAVNHQCVNYECCTDSQCSGNKTCVDHACKEPEIPFECYGDKDCKDSQRCDIVAGDKGGKCKDITGCGEVKNHALTPYECGTAPGCPSCGYGQTCIDTRCKTFGLKSPETGFVGDGAKVHASEDNVSCINCDLRITDPTGKVLTGKTDTLGNFTLPLKSLGIYKVALLRNDTLVRTIEVRSLPKAPGTEEKPPTAVGGDAGAAVLWVISLLAVIVIAIVFLRRRKPGEKGRIGPA